MFDCRYLTPSPLTLNETFQDLNRKSAEGIMMDFCSALATNLTMKTFIKTAFKVQESSAMKGEQALPNRDGTGYTN